MIKSMQESGGTVLSTDWADVSKRRVEPQRGGWTHDMNNNLSYDIYILFQTFTSMY